MLQENMNHHVISCTHKTLQQTLQSMAEAGKCWGHREQEARKKKIQKLMNSPGHAVCGSELQDFDQEESSV